MYHLLGVNWLCASRGFCGVHGWQNDTRCRDGMNVLRCPSHLVLNMYHVTSNFSFGILRRVSGGSVWLNTTCQGP